MKSKIYFHVGFPKSASTTLQKQLFDRHSQINFFGIYPVADNRQGGENKNINTLYLKNDSFKKFHNCLTNLEGIEYSFSNVEKYYEDIRSHLNSMVNVFSNERFASVLFAHKDRAEKARRIKKFFPDTKIIIVIRNQIDIIKSQYRDQPFDPRNLYANQKNVTINEWVERDLENYDISFMQSIEYYKFVKYYCELFGRENVGVFLFEELVNDLKSFANKISNFLEINSEETFKLLKSKHENDGFSKKLNSYRRFRARLSNYIPHSLKSSDMVKNINNIIFDLLKRGEKEHINMSDQTKKIIYNYYDKQNKLLSDEYNLELKKYGYMY